MANICDRCGVDFDTLPLGAWPFCRGNQADHAPGHSNVITDDIPGGVEIAHGICNEDGTPRRYYSKSSMTAEAKRRGLINYVVHRPERGSDRSPHTSRWI